MARTEVQRIIFSHEFDGSRIIEDIKKWNFLDQRRTHQ